ncbi:MAG: DoxX family protein [Verrucomicrobiota bacterium]
MNFSKLIRRIATGIVVVLVGQTLFFKFTAAPESVALFTHLGIEPFGRIGIGVAELIAIVLILIPRTTVFGALLTSGLMSGALFAHATQLGFTGDMGPLAASAGVVLVAALTVLWFVRASIPVIGTRLAPVASSQLVPDTVQS